MSRNTAGRDSETPSFRIPIALNAAALVLILISQTYFRRMLEARKIDLPFQTEIALGAMPLVFLSAIQLLTFVMKRWANVRLKCLWVPIAVSACGAVVGQHMIGIWLAFPHGPVDLSFRLPTSSSLPFALESRGARECREEARKLKYHYDPDHDSDSRPSTRFAGRTRTSFLLRANAAMPDKLIYHDDRTIWFVGEAHARIRGLTMQPPKQRQAAFSPQDFRYRIRFIG